MYQKKERTLPGKSQTRQISSFLDPHTGHSVPNLTLFIS